MKYVIPRLDQERYKTYLQSCARFFSDESHQAMRVRPWALWAKEWPKEGDLLIIGQVAKLLVEKITKTISAKIDFFIFPGLC